MTWRTAIIRQLLQINEAIFFYPKLQKFYKKHIPKHAVSVIDVGANRGQSIDFFLKIFPESSVFAFEPNPKLATMLTKKYQENSRISIQNLGISNVDGQLEFQENALDETSSFEQLNFDSDYLSKKAAILGVAVDKLVVNRYNVSVITLSEFIKRHPQFYDVLKIDVEGHELRCLEGLFQNGSGVVPIRFIQLENHNDDMYVAGNKSLQIESLLTANNFQLAARIKHGFGDFEELIYENKSI